jgi:elongin-A
VKDDRELWIEFFKRDVPQWEQFELPETSDCWYKVYCNLYEQVQREVEEDAERLKLALDGINSERAKHTSKFVADRRMARLPREQPTNKQKFALHDRKMGGLAPIYVPKVVGGEKTWGLERPELPRLGKKSQLFMAKRNKVLAVPTHRLNNKASQIKHAPRSLIEEHKRPLNPALDTRPVPQKASPPPLKTPYTAVMKQPRASLSAPSQQTQVPRLTRASRLSKTSIKTAAPKGNVDSGSPARRGQTTQPTLISSSPTPSNSPDTRVKLSSVHGAKISPSHSSDGESSKDRPSSPLPLPRMRKRPPPNVFIQQAKRKKIA